MRVRVCVCVCVCADTDEYLFPSSQSSAGSSVESQTPHDGGGDQSSEAREGMEVEIKALKLETGDGGGDQSAEARDR